MTCHANRIVRVVHDVECTRHTVLLKTHARNAGTHTKGRTKLKS